ncbi:hypothetical protein LVJ94_29575 [Pendulispora rubella]|uniref:Lipoprotein n=1 Tax=Pendulispora rubella TaxID=2741070 RepID=A0ABZ2KQX6_9BACT
MRVLSLFTLALLACGPSVSEVRMMAAPPREANCELEFLQLKVQDVAAGGKYEILGHVVLGQEGVQDPLDPKYREQVRPRACRMGGEGVAVMMTAVAEGGLGQHGTSIDYVVVRKHQEPTASTKPTKF